MSYPISTIVALDVDARPAALAARRQLSLPLDAADGNHVEAGDAVVILPTSKVGAGDCAEAWYYYDLHACSGLDSSLRDDIPEGIGFLEAKILDAVGDIYEADYTEQANGVLTGVANGNFSVRRLWASSAASKTIRLEPGEHLVCYAYAADLFGPAPLLPPETVAGFDAPPPPPPVFQRCPGGQKPVGTDENGIDSDGFQQDFRSFRRQFGVELRVSPPLLGADRAEFVARPPGPPAADGDDDASEGETLGLVGLGAGGKAPAGDLVRLLPACEEGCGVPLCNPPNYASSCDDFPWVQVNGAGALPVDGLAAAAYKACYVYKEDIDSKGEPPEALWVPVPLESFLVRARRASDAAAAAPPSTALAHGDPIDATIPAGDWVYRAPTSARPTARRWRAASRAPLALARGGSRSIPPPCATSRSTSSARARDRRGRSRRRGRAAHRRARLLRRAGRGGAGTRRRLSEEGRPGSQPPRLRAVRR